MEALGSSDGVLQGPSRFTLTTRAVRKQPSGVCMGTRACTESALVLGLTMLPSMLLLHLHSLYKSLYKAVYD